MAAYSSSKLSVKDSFEDEEVSDDVEDEVFIRDGRNGFKVDEELGVKRPLMAPRRKSKNQNNFHPELCKRPRCRRCCMPYCYILLAIVAFLGLVMTFIMLLNYFPLPLERLRQWSSGNVKKAKVYIPCTDFYPQEVWVRSFPKFKSEAAITSTDLNQDSVNDFIIGFATGIELLTMPSSCSHFNLTAGVCGGGAIALDGKTGSVLWTYWTRKDILFVDCGANVNSDKTKDCLLSGQGGVLSTVDGRTGNLIWELAKPSTQFQIDDYSAQFVPDIDNDGIPDVLVAHTSDQSGHVLILNGRNGHVIGRIETPNKESVFTVPRLTVRQDGSYLVIFATGNVEAPGSLYAIPLYKLALSDVSKCVNIWTDKVGVTSGIVLADMNSDGMEDIIITSGDKLSVLSGTDFSLVWNITLKGTADPMQILIGPTPAYFDDDFTPDLLITHMIGPSFPTYYYSQTWVANGKGGTNLLEDYIQGGGDITAPGITISYSGIGNDMYLYWLTTCNQPKLQTQPFTFSQGSLIHEQTHADVCRLRFNSTLETKLLALNQHIEPPGILLYSSAVQWEVEHNNTETTTTKPEMKNTEPWVPPRPSSFRHNFQQKPPHYQYPPPSPEETPVLQYPRFQHDPMQTQDWEPQPVSYGDSLNGFPGINLGDVQLDYDPLYQQEAEAEDSTFNLGEGRDERASRTRPRRSTSQNYGNLPRATSTATLAPSLSGTGIDIVFATHWESPSSNVRILTQKDQECVQRKIAAAQSAQNKLLTLGMEVLQETAERECLDMEGELLPDQFGLGQMTVYRLSLSCKCSHLKEGEVCSSPVPLDKQSYSHRAGDVYFKRRTKTMGKV